MLRQVGPGYFRGACELSESSLRLYIGHRADRKSPIFMTDCTQINGNVNNRLTVSVMPIARG